MPKVKTLEAEEEEEAEVNEGVPKVNPLAEGGAATKSSLVIMTTSEF